MTVMINAMPFKIPTDGVTRNQKFVFYVIGAVTLISLIPNFYSWQMTSTGMVLSGYIPPSTMLMDSATAAMLFAAILQITIFLLFILAPWIVRVSTMTWSWLRPLSLSVLFTFLLALMAISWGYSLFSTTLNSMSAPIKNQLDAEVETLERSLRAIDKRMTTSYLHQLQVLDQSAEAAAQGRDGSGIAKCGAICKRFQTARLTLTQKYGNLSQVIAFDSNAAARSTVVARYGAISQELKPMVLAKVKTFREFLSEPDVNGKDETQVWLDSVQLAEVNLVARLEAGTTEGALVMDYLKSQLEKFGHQPVDGTIYFAIVMAVIPDIVNLALAFIMLNMSYLRFNRVSS